MQPTKSRTSKRKASADTDNLVPPAPERASRSRMRATVLVAAPEPAPPVKKDKPTKAEVQAARDAAAAAAEDSRVKDIKMIAATEDRMRREQREEQQNAERPDLRTFATLKPPPPPPPPAADITDAMEIDQTARVGTEEDIGDVPDQASSAGDDDYLPESGEAGEPQSDDDASSGVVFSDEEEALAYQEMRKKVERKKKAKVSFDADNARMINALSLKMLGQGGVTCPNSW